MRREANAELRKSVEELDALMNTEKDPAVLNVVRNLKAEMESVGIVVSAIEEQLRTAFTDGFADALTDIITMTKSVSSAFKSMASSVLKSMASMASKSFSESIMKNLFSKKDKDKKTTTGSAGASTALSIAEKKTTKNFDELAKATDKNIIKVGDSTDLMDENNTLSNLANTTTDAGNTKNITLQASLDLLTTAATSAATALQTVAASSGSSSGKSSLWTPFVPHLATGGHVSGEGTETSDSIPAMLSNGEYIIPAAIVKKFGKGLFDSIKGGSLPPAKFASGGSVSSSSSGTSSSSSSDGGSAPNVSINLINNSGTQLESTNSGMKFDGKRWVMQMWLSGVSSNTLGSKDMLKGLK